MCSGTVITISNGYSSQLSARLCSGFSLQIQTFLTYFIDSNPTFTHLETCSNYVWVHLDSPCKVFFNRALQTMTVVPYPWTGSLTPRKEAEVESPHMVLGPDEVIITDSSVELFFVLIKESCQEGDL